MRSKGNDPPFLQNLLGRNLTFSVLVFIPRMRTCNVFFEWHYLFDQRNRFEKLDGPNATNNERILATTYLFVFRWEMSSSFQGTALLNNLWQWITNHELIINTSLVGLRETNLFCGLNWEHDVVVFVFFF